MEPTHNNTTKGVVDSVNGYVNKRQFQIIGYQASAENEMNVKDLGDGDLFVNRILQGIHKKLIST